MFTTNDIGERVWFWDGRNYRARHPQKVMAFGDSWSFHFRNIGGGWTRYRLYTKATGGKSVWNLTIGRGAFARGEDFRILMERAPYVLKWMMDAHNGVFDDFPIERLLGEDWERFDNERLGRSEPILSDWFLKTYGAIKTANEQGYPVALEGKKFVSLFRVMEKDHLFRDKDKIRDYVSEMLFVKAITHSSNGYKVIRNDMNGIRDDIAKTGAANRRCP